MISFSARAVRAWFVIDLRPAASARPRDGPFKRNRYATAVVDIWRRSNLLPHRRLREARSGSEHAKAAVRRTFR